MLIWPSELKPQTLVFFSDLHLFSSRSTADTHMEVMLEFAEKADIVVFGGDLFDLRWSRVGGPRKTIEAAIEWLSEFTNVAGDREYVYLYGNHDGDADLRVELSRWSSEQPGFTIAGDWLRVNDVVLLHGDAIEGAGDSKALDLYRMRWSLKPQASLAQSRAYDAAVTIGAHRVAAMLAHRRRRTYQRLLTYLVAHHLGPQQGIRRVVFGHTHRHEPGKSYGGLRFYNPGATIRGVPFQPVLLQIESSDP